MIIHVLSLDFQMHFHHHELDLNHVLRTTFLRQSRIKIIPITGKFIYPEIRRHTSKSIINFLFRRKKSEISQWRFNEAL